MWNYGDVSSQNFQQIRSPFPKRRALSDSRTQGQTEAVENSPEGLHTGAAETPSQTPRADSISAREPNNEHGSEDNAARIFPRRAQLHHRQTEDGTATHVNRAPRSTEQTETEMTTRSTEAIVNSDAHAPHEADNSQAPTPEALRIPADPEAVPSKDMPKQIQRLRRTSNESPPADTAEQQSPSSSTTGILRALTHEMRSKNTKLSAFTVTVFAAAGCLTWTQASYSWAFVGVMVLASLLLAIGWPKLTGIPLHPFSQGIIALAGAVTAISVEVSKDLNVGVLALSLSVAALVVTTITVAPTPHSHASIHDVWKADDTPRNISAPQAEPRGNNTTDSGKNHGHIGFPRRKDLQLDARSMRAGSTQEDPPVPITISIGVGMMALLTVAGGGAWVALNVLQQWRLTVPIACVIVVMVVWGGQLGTTYRWRSLSALIFSLIAGITASYAAWFFGETTLLTPLVFPGVARVTSDFIALMTMGVATGLSIACSIIVVDGCFGERRSFQSSAGAFARGTAKFLIAAIPIYSMIRIGGI